MSINEQPPKDTNSVESIGNKLQDANFVLNKIVEGSSKNDDSVPWGARSQEWFPSIFKALNKTDEKLDSETVDLIEPMTLLAFKSFQTDYPNNLRRDKEEAKTNPVFKAWLEDQNRITDLARKTFRTLSERYGEKIPNLNIDSNFKESIKNTGEEIKKTFPDIYRDIGSRLISLSESDDLPFINYIAEIDELLEDLSGRAQQEIYYSAQAENGTYTESGDYNDEDFRLKTTEEIAKILPYMKTLMDLRTVMSNKEFGHEKTANEVIMLLEDKHSTERTEIDYNEVMDWKNELGISEELGDFLDNVTENNVGDKDIKEIINPESDNTLNPEIETDEKEETLPEPPPEVVEQFNKLPEKEKTAITKGLLQIGFGTKKLKSKAMASLAGLSYSTYQKLHSADTGKEVKDQGYLARFLYQTKESYLEDSRDAQAKIDQIDSKGRAMLGLGHPLGLGIKVYRNVADYTKLFSPNPLRGGMILGMIAGRTFNIAKDARLLDRDISKKTGRVENPEEQILQAEKEMGRIQTITNYLREQVAEASEENKAERKEKLNDFLLEKATRRAFLQDQIDNLRNNPNDNTLTFETTRDKFASTTDKEQLAKKRDLARQIIKRHNTANSLLNKSFLSKDVSGKTEEEIEKEKNDIKEKVEKIVSSGDGIITNTREFIGDTFQKFIDWDAKTSINSINKKISKIEKISNLSAEEKDKKIKSLVSKYAKHIKDIDKMTSRYGTVDIVSYALSKGEFGAKVATNALVLESLLLPFYDHLINFIQDVNSDDLVEAVKTSPSEKIDSPNLTTWGEVEGESSTEIQDTIYKATDKNSRPILSLLENTGADVTMENGITKVVYEIGQGKDFSALDQTLRRIVAQEFSFGDDRVFSNVEAARMENILANVRELLQGKAVAGLTPSDIKGLAHFDNGQLQITNYEQFKNKILDKLTDRAEQNINSDSPAVKFAQATSKKVWEEILDKKNSVDVQVDPHFFNQAKETVNSITDRETSPGFESLKTKVADTIVDREHTPEFEPLKNVTPKPNLDQVINFHKTVATLTSRYHLPETEADQILNIARNLKLDGIRVDGHIEIGGHLDALAKIFSGDNLDLLKNIEGKIDPEQIRIFKEIVYLSGDSDKIRSVLAVTRSINWEEGKEVALAKSLFLDKVYERTDQLKFLREAFGTELVSNKTTIEFNGTDIKLKSIGDYKGTMTIDFAKRSVMLSRLLKDGQFVTDQAYFDKDFSKDVDLGKALVRIKEYLPKNLGR